MAKVFGVFLGDGFLLKRLTGALGEQCTTGSPFEVILIFGWIDGRFSAGSGLAKPRLIRSSATFYNFFKIVSFSLLTNSNEFR
jgi:hypothetical protein